jgi:uncharacterized protein YukJ
VLKAKAVGSRSASGTNPHYQVHVVDDADEYRIAVNVQSQDKSDLEYVLSSQVNGPDGLRSHGLRFRRPPRYPDYATDPL